MKRLFLSFLISLMFGMGYNIICSENHHTGPIDALMLALKISHEGYHSVKEEIERHSFSQWTFHDPRDGGCMNGLYSGTRYSPFTITCPRLKRDDSALSQAIYRHIDREAIFCSKNELYNHYIGCRAGCKVVDHCTRYAIENDSSVCVYSHFFDKAALVALFKSLTSNEK